MAKCTFTLNSQMYSDFVCDVFRFPAFSGNGEDRNNPASGHLKDQGPVPLGLYYIVDRPPSHLEYANQDLGPAIDRESGKDQWFALYRWDAKIDDETPVGGPGTTATRDQLRLHAGQRSAGCITLEYPRQFFILRSYLVGQPPEYIPSTNTKTRTYGTLVVTI